MMSLVLLLMLEAQVAFCSSAETLIMSKFVSELGKISGKELILVGKGYDLDGNKDTRVNDVAAKLAQSNFETALSAYSLDGLIAKLNSAAVETCPIFYLYGNVTEFTHENRLYERTKNVMPSFYQSRSIFFWMDTRDDLNKIFHIANLSTLNCPQKLDYGAFGPNSMILFVSSSQVLIEEALLKFKPLIKHPQLLGIQHSVGKELNLIVWQKPPKRSSDFLTINKVFHMESRLSSLSQVVMQPKSFDGATIVSSLHDRGRPADEEGFLPRRNWISSGELIMTTLRLLEEKLGATAKVRQTPTRSTAFLDDQGNYLGDHYLLMNDLVDIGATSFLQYYNGQTTEICPVLFINTYFTTFAAPAPKALPPTRALVQPFEWQMWVILAISLPFTLVALGILDQLFAKVHSTKGFQSFGHLTWFGIACVLRQDFKMLAQDNLRLSTSYRLALLLWLFFVFLVTAGYSGNLRSFLINTGYEEPIDSVEDILNSGLPWKWYHNQASAEVIIAQSKRPDLQRLWGNQIPIYTLVGRSINQELRDVLEGKNVLIASSLMGTVVEIAYTTPDGQRMIHYSGKPILESTRQSRVVLFPILSRWSQLLTRVYRQLLETGIAQKLNDFAKMSIRGVYIKRGLLYDFTTLQEDEKALGIFELQGIFALFVVLVLLALAVFAAEKTIFIIKKRNSGNRVEDLK